MYFVSAFRIVLTIMESFLDVRNGLTLYTVAAICTRQTPATSAVSTSLVDTSTEGADQLRRGSGPWLQ